MEVVGTVASLWRYPVKSMRGEEVAEAQIGPAGVQGDRLFAFHSSRSLEEFPYFTARDQRQMLRYVPQLRADAAPNESTIEVLTPDGLSLAIDDPALLNHLRAGLALEHDLTLLRSEAALTDAAPVSLISLQTIRQLSTEAGTNWDARRFRASIYLDLGGSDGFAEDAWVGRSLRVGTELVLNIRKRDARCMMITLDPESVETSPLLLKKVAQNHDGACGVYADVATPGRVQTGDPVTLVG